MYNIIKNELYKVFHGKRLYVFLGILLALFIIPLIESLTGALEGFPMNGQNLSLNMLAFLSTNIIPGFIIVMMAGMITDEYIGGTLVLNLLHPVSRAKLLAAKMCAMTVALLTFLGFTLLTGYVLGTIFFGWGDAFIFQETVYSTQEGILLTVGSYLISLLPTLAFAAFAMLTAMLFSSSGVTVGVLLASVVGMSLLGQLLEGIQPYLIIYQLPFFQTALMGGEWREILSSLAVITVYGLGSYFIAVHLFKKKDLVY